MPKRRSSQRRGSEAGLTTENAENGTPTQIQPEVARASSQSDMYVSMDATEEVTKLKGDVERQRVELQQALAERDSEKRKAEA